MSKISDEIRKVADEYDVTPLYALADRIDAEMVKLPKDADGVPIHLGHTVFTKDDPETSWSVRYIEFRCGREQSIGIESNGVNTYRQPSCLTHTAPDSLERIANELDEQAGSLTKDGYTWQEDAIHDFADRIRKLAKEGER